MRRLGIDSEVPLGMAVGLLILAAAIVIGLAVIAIRLAPPRQSQPMPVQERVDPDGEASME